jgi:hypothetical protein
MRGNLYSSNLAGLPSRNIYQRRKAIDSIFYSFPTANRDFNSPLWTYINTSSTTPTGITSNSTIANQRDGIDKAHALSTGPTANTTLSNRYNNPRHFRSLVADLRGNMRQYPPQTTAGAAAAYSEKLVARADAKPD